MEGKDVPQRYEFRIIRKDGEVRSVEGFASSVQYQGKPASQVALIDISDRKRAEEERIQREKLQGVLEMAGATCHELNQPLQSISGYTDLLAITIEEGNSPDQYIDNIRTQVEILAQITHKLMHLTKYETKPYLKGQIVDIDKSEE